MQLGNRTTGHRRGSERAAGPPDKGAVRYSLMEFGRGERDCPATTDLPITMRLAEPPEPFDWLRSA